jgi:signal peptidase I
MNQKKINSWLKLLENGLDPDEEIELPVLSGSMLPVMIPGKNIKIKNIPLKNLRTGDIIVFRKNKILTGHRILFKIRIFSYWFFYQKGDRNRFGGWIRENDIVGIVGYAQDNFDTYIDFTGKKYKRRTKVIAFRQIIKLLINIVLYIPRKIKH